MDAKNPLSKSSQGFKKLVIIAQFIIAIIILNYSSMSSQSITDAMIGENYVNSETNKSEIFHSVNALYFIEKGVAFLLSWLILRCLKKSEQDQQLKGSYQQGSQLACIGEGGYRQATGNNKHLNEAANQTFRLSTAQQVILGALTFIAFQVFMRLQLSLNVIFMVISKYVNFFFIVMFFHYAMPSRSRNTNESVFTLSYFIAMLKDLFYSIPVIVGVIFIKSNFSQLSSMYRSNAGISLVEKMSLTDYSLWGLAFIVDYFLYGWIKKVKQNNNIVEQTTLKADGAFEYRNPLMLLNLWAKYTALFFLIYIIATGELFYMAGFMTKHHNIIVHLIKISLYHFVSQYIVCHIILTYRLHVFFSMVVTIGIFSKLRFYTFQDFTLGGIPYFSVFIGFCFMLSQIINEKLEKANNSSECQTGEKETKVYGSVEFDEKEEESRQLDLDGDDYVHLPMGIARE